MIVEMKYSEEIIKRLATASVPLSPYDLKKETKFPYSGIRETIKQLCNEGYVRLTSTEQSKKGGERTLYTLTFKGVLKYLAGFKILPDSFAELTQKDIKEFYEKFDKEHKSGILNALERQGEILNYVPFQECHWLSERIPGLTGSFVTGADFLLKQPLSGESLIADAVSKYISDPNYEPYAAVDDVLFLRDIENSSLRVTFGKFFLRTMVSRIKDGAENENGKLRQFAERILDESRIEITQLEHAVSLFSLQKKG
ncbi:MAG: hypothetical protein ABR909_13700 [Candidatus Bathyarchaeia archaeon]|jgi:DNA-binding PadR family transcriptional regulator